MQLWSSHPSTTQHHTISKYIQRTLISIILLRLHEVGAVSAVAVRQSTVIPAPISVAPSQVWDGNDGPWSSFALQLGSPPQSLKVLISTASYQTWVVAAEGCSLNDPADCPEARGGLYNYSLSSTYAPNLASLSSDVYLIEIESQLGYEQTARYGFDDLTLGWPGAGGPTLKNQTIAGMAKMDFYTGFLGLVPRPSNFTTLNNPIPSYLDNLKSRAMIPSLSWAYTAGNQYRLSGVLGSLTLGGYDSSKFISNALSIPFDDKDIRDLTLQIQAITTSTTLLSATPQVLLTTPINVFLDSTVPYIYLPPTACALFESAFNLTYNATSKLYLLSAAQHNSLLALNPTITFTISAVSPGSLNTTITLPYAAFDLTASYPLVANSTRYFPLRQASNSSQYILGRTFFQEAYVIADYERRNFSVSQCDWSSSRPRRIVSIISPSVNLTDPSPSQTTAKKSLSTGLIAGISIGAAAVLLAILALFTCFCIIPRHRRRRLARIESQPPTIPALPTTTPSSPLSGEHPSHIYHKAELDATTTTVTPALHETQGSPVPTSPPATEVASSSWDSSQLGSSSAAATTNANATGTGATSTGDRDQKAELTANEEVAAEVGEGSTQTYTDEKDIRHRAELGGKMRRAELDSVGTEVGGLGVLPFSTPAPTRGIARSSRPAGLIVGGNIVLMNQISPEYEGEVESNEDIGMLGDRPALNTMSWEGRPSLEFSRENLNLSGSGGSVVVSPRTPGFADNQVGADDGDGDADDEILVSPRTPKTPRTMGVGTGSDQPKREYDATVDSPRSPRTPQTREFDNAREDDGSGEEKRSSVPSKPTARKKFVDNPATTSQSQL